MNDEGDDWCVSGKTQTSRNALYFTSLEMGDGVPLYIVNAWHGAPVAIKRP